MTLTPSTEARLPAVQQQDGRMVTLLRVLFGRGLPPVIFSVLFLGGWQFGTSASGISDVLLPAPTEVAQSLWQDRSLLLNNAWITLQELLIGFGLAIILGIALGISLHRFRLLERAVYPWLVVSQAVPTVAIAPIFVLWTGFDIRPKVLVIVLVSFFPLVVGTIDGLNRGDPDLVDLLRTLGARTPRIFLDARLPAALPSIFTGLKVAAVLSIIGAVFGEWAGSSDGLGYLILTFNNQTATPEVFAVIVVLALLGIGLFGLVALVERLSLPWRFAARRKSPWE